VSDTLASLPSSLVESLEMLDGLIQLPDGQPLNVPRHDLPFLREHDPPMVDQVAD